MNNFMVILELHRKTVHVYSNANNIKSAVDDIQSWLEQIGTDDWSIQRVVKQN